MTETQEWINVPSIEAQVLPDVPAEQPTREARKPMADISATELDAILAADKKKAKIIKKLVANLEETKQQRDDLATELDSLRRSGKDTRLVPLNARRTLFWIGVAFVFLALFAILGAIVGPQ